MRLFIGLSLNAPARENTATLAGRVQTRIPGRYVLPSNYHMTLAFLGEVSPDQLPEAAQALDAFAAQFSAPRLILGPISHFGKVSNAILIRTVASPVDLSALHTALQKELSSRSLPFTDGPFSPHITLARHADTSHTPLETLPVDPVSYVPAHVTLFLSARDKENILRYTPLHTAAFHQPL